MKQLTRFLKVALAAVIIAALIYLAQPRELWAALTELTWQAVFYLALLSVLLILVSAYKWQLFVAHFGSKVPLLRLFNLYLVGYFVNQILPSYIGGDMLRSYYLGRKVGQHEAAAATILERYTGMVAMVSLAFVFVWFAELASTEIKVIVVLIAAGLATITCMVLAPQLITLLERVERLRGIAGHVHRVQEGLALGASDGTLLFKTLALSFVFHSLTVVNTMAAAYAVGWNGAQFGELMVVLPLILLIGALPLTPSGLGLQEGAFFVFLQGVGASPAQALAVGVVLRAKSYVLGLFGGLVWLRVRRR